MRCTHRFMLADCFDNDTRCMHTAQAHTCITSNCLKLKTKKCKLINEPLETRNMQSKIKQENEKRKHLKVHKNITFYDANKLMIGQRIVLQRNCVQNERQTNLLKTKLGHIHLYVDCGYTCSPSDRASEIHERVFIIVVSK